MSRFVIVSLPTAPGNYWSESFAIVDTRPHDKYRPEWGVIWAICSTTPAAVFVRLALEATPPPEPDDQEPF